MTDTGAIRSAMRARRSALDAAQQEQAAQAVLSHLRALDGYRSARCVMAYMAARGELSLAPVIADVLAGGRALVLPRCEEPGVMTARRIEGMEQLVRGAYGLLEPDASCEAVDPRRIDLVLAPGTAFDRAGGRLGQGGGYYDRFLADTPALRMGICHEFALVDVLPLCAHDQRMDMIITPAGMIACGAYRIGRVHDEQSDR